MTEVELRLWIRLRGEQIGGHRFRRQVPIGPYVVDFACLKARLVVELDGGQHATAGERDERRTAWLESRGFAVLRFWNTDVLESLDGVLEKISAALTQTPSPTLPAGGREKRP